MPWDLAEVAARAARQGPVTVVDMEPADLTVVLADVVLGGWVLIHWPGPDDAREIADVLIRPSSPGPGSGAAGPQTRAHPPGSDVPNAAPDQHQDRSMETVAAALAHAGIRVVDGAQWRGAYRFLDADAVLDFLALAWWLPTKAQFTDTYAAVRGLDQGRSPIVATLSRFWVLGRRSE